VPKASLRRNKTIYIKLKPNTLPGLKTLNSFLKNKALKTPLQRTGFEDIKYV